MLDILAGYAGYVVYASRICWLCCISWLAMLAGKEIYAGLLCCLCGLALLAILCGYGDYDGFLYGMVMLAGVLDILAGYLCS
jgi:hypothetical protein